MKEFIVLLISIYLKVEYGFVAADGRNTLGYDAFGKLCIDLTQTEVGIWNNQGRGLKGEVDTANPTSVFFFNDVKDLMDRFEIYADFYPEQDECKDVDALVLALLEILDIIDGGNFIATIRNEGTLNGFINELEHYAKVFEKIDLKCKVATLVKLQEHIRKYKDEQYSLAVPFTSIAFATATATTSAN